MAGSVVRVVGFVVALGVALGGWSAVAAERVALVIGNGAYRLAPHLANPPADARAMAASLERLGFAVVAGYDLDREGMIQALKTFRQRVAGADIALIFYAGHGIQIAGHNYLLPVDVRLADEKDLEDEAVSVERVMAEAETARRLRVVILDACRDNPFGARMARSMGSRSTLVGRGFARIETADGNTLIAYATKEDMIAADGSGDHSPYTAALLQHLETPGLPIERLFGRVRDTVMTATEGRQQPFTYGSLGGDPIYLMAPARPAGPASRSATGETAAAVTAATAADEAVELTFWDAIKHSSRPADYRAYLETYPEGRFAALARVRAEPVPSASPAAAAERRAVAAETGPAPVRSGQGLYALVVGIDAYQSLPPLSGSVSDARDIAEAVTRAGARDLRLLLDAKATRNAVLTAFRELVAEAQPGDTVVFAFSGQADQRPEYVAGSEPTGMDEFLVLAGYGSRGEGANELILDDELARLFKSAAAVNVVFVVDAGHSGTMADAIAPGGNLFYFGAVADGETPPLIKVDGVSRGALSWAFARAVEGAADTGNDGILSKGELERFVQAMVTGKTKGLQRPVTGPPGRLDDPLIQYDAMVVAAPRQTAP